MQFTACTLCLPLLCHYKWWRKKSVSQRNNKQVFLEITFPSLGLIMDHSQIYSCHRWHKELSNFVTFVLLIEQSIINTDDFHSCKQRSAGEPVCFDRISASNLLSLKAQNSPCLPLMLLSCSVLAPRTLPLPLNATWHGTYVPTFSHLQSQNKLQTLLSLAAHWQWKLKCKSSSLCALFCY